jgi:hypothetical protein
MSALPQRYASLRIAVAILGQSEAAGWWTSSFLTPGGISIARYNFPRAADYAALNSTTVAAKRLHDERIGKRRCVHLFRLPLGEEALIQRAILEDDCALLKSRPTTRAEAMKVLEAESGGLISVVAGPVQIGSITNAFSEAGIVELAKHYLAAFTQGIQCLPYFANVKS